MSSESSTCQPSGNTATAEDLLWTTLRRCPPLTCSSHCRDELWFVVQRLVCTQRARSVTPYGSSAEVRVGREHASQELVAAMDWLHAHETEARALAPDRLLTRLRGVASRGANGSGRLAQSDRLQGMTDVPSDGVLLWYSLDCEEGA